MRIGVHVVARVTGDDTGVGRFRHLVRVADESGFARISTGDVHGNHLECVSALTLMATVTKRARIGVQVTHPVTRDPGVLAAALASLQAISEGRTYAVIGRGDGAARNVGRRPATVGETEEYFLAVRDLLDRSETTYRGRALRLPWPSEEPRRVPLLLAAEGPRMLALAGAVADGVVIGTGLTPEVIAASRTQVESAARRAGRDPDELHLWWTARCSVATTRDHACLRARETLSSVANHALRGDYAEKLVPAELHDPLRRYHAEYSYIDKNPVGEGSPNGELLDRLGLVDYVAERFGLLGSSEQITERARTLDALGVTALHLSVENASDLTALGDGLLPASA